MIFHQTKVEEEEETLQMAATAEKQKEHDA